MVVPSLRPKEEIVAYTGEYTARVDLPGQRADAIVEAVGEPIAIDRPAIGLTPVDLELRQSARGWAVRNAKVMTQFPPNLGGKVDFGTLPGIGDASLKLADMSATGRDLGDRKVFYANASRDTDVLVAPTPLGASVNWIIRSPHAPETLRFDLDAGPDSEVSVTPDGGVEVMRDGEVVGTVTEPIARDAQGTPISVRFESVAGRPVVRIDHRRGDYAYPIAIDPYIVWNGIQTIKTQNPDGAPNISGWYTSTTAAGKFTFETNSEPPGIRFYVKTNLGSTGSGVASWRIDPPRESTAYRVEYMNVAHNPSQYDTLQAGIYSKTTGFADTTWGGYYDTNWNFQGAANWVWGSASAYAPQFHVVGCANGGNCAWGGSVDNMVVFQDTLSVPGGQQVTTRAKSSFRGAYIYMSDYSNPTLSLSGLNAFNSYWQSDADLNVHANVSDPGVGLGYISGPYNPWRPPAFEKYTNYNVSNGAYEALNRYGSSTCEGGTWDPCPDTGSFDTDVRAGATNYIFNSFDIVGHLAPQSINNGVTLKIDNEPPAVAVSGRLGSLLNDGLTAEQSPRVITRASSYKVTATDGSTSASTARRSGVKELKAWLTGSNTDGSDNGVQIGSMNTVTTACDGSTSNGTQTNDSCDASLTSAIDPSTLNPGYYYLHVNAIDQIGQVTSKSYKFGVGLGDIDSVSEGMSTARYVPLQASIDRSGVTAASAKFQWRAAVTDSWQDVPLNLMRREDTGETPSSTSHALDGNGQTERIIVDVASLTQSGGGLVKDGDIHFRAVFENTTPPFSAEWARSSEDVLIRLDRGGASTADDVSELGPGSVDLMTGNLGVSVTDFSQDAYRQSLSVARTYNSRYASPNDDQGVPRKVGLLGPGWKVDLETDAATFEKLTDYSDIRIDEEFREPYVALKTVDGVELAYELVEPDPANPTAPDVYRPEPGAERLRLERIRDVANDPASTTDSFKLTDLDSGTVTTFGKDVGDTSPDQVGEFEASQVLNPGSAETVVFNYETYTDSSGNARLRPLAAIAPSPGGNIQCAGAVSLLPRGCQALEFEYLDLDPAVDRENPRIDYVQLRTYNPSSGQMATDTVVEYQYDTNGRLIEAWDYRVDPPLKTTYAYDSNNLLTSVTPPGEDPISVGYESAAGDLTPGRVNDTSRHAPGSGTATWAVRYGVPLSGGNAPYDMSNGSVATWAQDVPPLTGTAVFPPDQPPNGSVPSNWSMAAISYLDPLGREVNSASPGNRITTTEYDRFGNVTRTLGAQNRITALQSANPAVTATKLDTQRVYEEVSDGSTRMIEELGPERLTKIDDDDPVLARAHTRITYDEDQYVYDEDKPLGPGVAFNLPTTTRTSALVASTGQDEDVKTTRNLYETANARKHSSPTAVISDPDGLAVTRRTVINDDGQEIERRQPSAPGNKNPGSADVPTTTKTIYYVPDAPSGHDSDCVNKPEWAGLPCKVKPGAQPTTGGLPDLPVKYVTSYNKFRQPITTVETVGSDTRTSTITYDPAGRESIEQVTGTVGHPVPKIEHVYSSTTGREVQTKSYDGSNTLLHTVTRTFDSNGRTTAYTDADGHTSTTSYDLLSRPLTTNDGKATRTNAYDSVTGDLVTVNDSHVGIMTATHDYDGKILSTALPGGLSKTYEYYEDGSVKRLFYTKTENCSSDCVWFDDQVERDAKSRIAKEVTNYYEDYFEYDNADRLKVAARLNNGQCAVRTYGFDANSNRTSKRTAQTTGACDLNGGSTVSSTYDNADRLTNSGYVYDAFGRITTVPQQDAGGTDNLTATYHVNDLARSITQNGTTQTLELDPLHRAHQQTKQTGSNISTDTYAFVDDSDSPEWIATATGSTTTWVRYIDGLDGQPAGTITDQGVARYLIQNIRGDILADGDDEGLVAALGMDEFGVPDAALPSGRRYGFLGAHKREALTSSGLVAMGVRLYAPRTGRFLQVDPMLGGNENPYEYPNDPVNRLDLTGKYGEEANDAEKKYCKGVHGPQRKWRCWKASKLAEKALRSAERFFPGTLHNGAGDAFRHCVWSGWMTNRWGADQAKKFGDLHEAGIPHDDPEKIMDRRNNRRGRKHAIATAKRYRMIRNRDGAVSKRCYDAARLGRLDRSSPRSQLW